MAKNTNPIVGPVDLHVVTLADLTSYSVRALVQYNTDEDTFAVVEVIESYGVRPDGTRLDRPTQELDLQAINEELDQDYVREIVEEYCC